MKLDFRFKILGLTSILLLATGTTWGANTSINQIEKIVSCSGERKGNYDPTDTFGHTLNIEVYQGTNSEFRWNLKILGKTQVSTETNGPINKDGTTVAPNGDEGLIYYRSFSEGVLLKEESGVLRGLFSYIETTYNEEYGTDEYYLVEYELSNCQLTGAKIDQREANIYNAKSELSDFAVNLSPFWLNGAGVNVNEYGLAEGIGIFAQDQAQLDAFILEFLKRGLIKQTFTDLRYLYNGADGETIEIPMTVTITGDITPPSA